MRNMRRSAFPSSSARGPAMKPAHTIHSKRTPLHQLQHTKLSPALRHNSRGYRSDALPNAPHLDGKRRYRPYASLDLQMRRRRNWLRFPKRHHDILRQGMVCKRVLLAGRHGFDESLDKSNHAFHRSGIVLQLIAQHINVHRCISVQRRGVESDGVNHGSTGIVFRCTIIDRREIVIFWRNLIDREGMGNLRRSISIQIRSISQHASKQSDIDSLGTMEDRRNFLLHLGNVLTLIKSSNRQISKLIDLIVCDENQIVGSPESPYLRPHDPKP